MSVDSITANYIYIHLIANSCKAKIICMQLWKPLKYDIHTACTYAPIACTTTFVQYFNDICIHMCAHFKTNNPSGCGMQILCYLHGTDMTFTLTICTTNMIESTMRAKFWISYILTVDALGDVINANLNKSKTTTNNEVLVNSVTTKVKNELKYNKIPGTDYQKIAYTVKL